MHSEPTKILVVDDLPEKLLVYRSILEAPDLEIVSAASGPEALKHLLAGDFAVVILDVNMPGMDGFETAALIRARKRSAHTPLIFVTAFADELHTVKGYAHGAVDYILAPVVPEILRTKVRVFVQLFRLAQQVREQAARQVAQAEHERARLLDVLENATDFVGRIDPAGRLLQVNRAGRRMLGYADDDPLPADVFGLHGAPSSAAAGDAPAATGPAAVLAQALDAARTQGLWIGEAVLLTRDGREVPVSEVILAHKPGPDAAAEPDSYSVIARDITDRKRAQTELALHRDRLQDLVRERTTELETTHQRLRLSERMASIGTLAAGLGHDMGNLLLPIRMRLESLEQFELPAAAREDLAAIKVASEYLKRLSHGLRLFAMDPQEAGAVGDATDLGAWWPEVHPFLRNALPKSVCLECQIPDGLPRVGMPPHRLTQVVFNLVQNAGDALRDRADGWVKVSAELQDPGAPGRPPTVCIEVSDNGAGMSEEVKNRCMEPFFTTKARGISTGLGLALVRGAVLTAGGSIDVRTAPGRGTAFRLTLPARPERGVDEPCPGRARRTARVALTDARLRAYVSMILRSHGVEVVAGDAAVLLIADPTGAGAEQVAQFLDGDPGRCAVLLGGTAAVRYNGRVQSLDAQPAPSRVRKAIADLLAGAGGGAHHASAAALEPQESRA